MLGRKGHLGTLLMVIGCLVLAITTLFVFHNVRQEADTLRADLRELTLTSLVAHRTSLLSVKDLISQSLSNVSDSNDFENDFKKSLSALANTKRVSGQNTNLYAQLALGTFSLNMQQNSYILLIPDIFEETAKNYSSVVYSYSLKATFNKTSVISIDTLLH